MNVRPTLDRVDGIFDRYLKEGSPGCALAVMQDGRIVYRQGYGLANLEHKIPIRPSTVFNIGSMAKQFTAFAIALLEADGKLALDDDCRRHLPELHDFGSKITVRHLIHHTSGLRGSFPELLALAGWRDTDTTTSEDVYRLLKAQRELNFEPGEEFLYVNSNYVLLAYIVEQASGQRFASFCQERIFGPLGMTQTYVNDSIVKVIPARAMGYYEDEQAGWLNAPLTDSVVGPTNIYSSVEDLAKWDENFCSGQVGGREVIERMEQPGHLNDGSELDYAFGLTVGPAHQHRGWKVVEHGGGQGGYGSWMVRFPEHHLSVVVLFNHFLWDMQDLALKVADQFLEQRDSADAHSSDMSPHSQPSSSIELDDRQLEARVGFYFDARRAALREVTQAEGRLRFQGLDLVPLRENLFAFEVEPKTRVEFIPVERGAEATVKTITDSGEYTYRRVHRKSPRAGELDQYAGHYYSPELDVYWRLEVGQGCLIARRHKYVDSTLTPLFDDAFNDDWEPIMGYPTSYLVIFERDAQNAIIRLRVSGTRVRHLRFVKLPASQSPTFDE